MAHIGRGIENIFLDVEVKCHMLTVNPFAIHPLEATEHSVANFMQSDTVSLFITWNQYLVFKHRKRNLPEFGSKTIQHARTRNAYPRL